MESWFSAVILGAVEGLTEFLPVSSTGHLILTNSLLGLGGEKIAAFDVIIQLGAILAVLVLYRQRFVGLIVPAPALRFSGRRGLWLLFLTSLPASIVGLLTHGYITRYLFGPLTVAAALGVGALAILYVESRECDGRFETLDDITPLLALGIGLFQCASLWPGFSRSAATIMGGMLLGARRDLAVEYSFIAAVPIMIAATGFDFLKTYHLFSAADFVFLAIGFVVSFVSAWAAVRFFIVMLTKITLRPFAWYRLALVPLIYFFWR